MYFSSVGGHFFKAQVQNHHEKARCNLYIKDIAKRHVHTLTHVNKSIQEARDALREIQASSGYCKEVQGNETAPKSNVWKERKWSTGKSQANDENPDRSETPSRRKTSALQEIRNKNLDSGEQQTVSKTSVDANSQSLLFHEKNEGNILKQSEYFKHGEKGAGSGNAGCEMNGDRSDIVPAGRLLRDEILTLPDSRNVSGRVIKGADRQGMDSDVKDPQGKVKSTSSANGANFWNTDTTSTTITGKSLGSLTSRTDEPPESAIGSSKLGNIRPNTDMGYRSQTAPEKASRLKSQVRSAPASESVLKKNSRSRNLSTNDVKKVKIHVSLSRTERKRILQELISSCAVPPDRSVLERERQRLLQEKIHRFFELLFQEDQKDEDDESDIFEDN